MLVIYWKREKKERSLKIIRREPKKNEIVDRLVWPSPLEEKEREKPPQDPSYSAPIL